MTLNELAKAVLDLMERGTSGDALVVLAKDAEGNDFSPLDELTRAGYKATSTWSGCIASEDEDGSQPAAVLWPTN